MSTKHYLSGKIYAQFSDTLKQYFYEDGTLKTVEPYLQEQLHGEVLLYHRNGKIKRKCHFERGERKGQDQMWDEEGKLIDESFYD